MIYTFLWIGKCMETFWTSINCYNLTVIQLFINDVNLWIINFEHILYTLNFVFLFEFTFCFHFPSIKIILIFHQSFSLFKYAVLIVACVVKGIVIYIGFDDGFKCIIKEWPLTIIKNFLTNYNNAPNEHSNDANKFKC